MAVFGIFVDPDADVDVNEDTVLVVEVDLVPLNQLDYNRYMSRSPILHRVAVPLSVNFSLCA